MMTNMSYSRRVVANGKIYNVPKFIDCSRCGDTKAELGSDVELYENRIKGAVAYEEDYKCVYTCKGCGHENTVIVTLKE